MSINLEVQLIRPHHLFGIETSPALASTHTRQPEMVRSLPFLFMAAGIRRPGAYGSRIRTFVGGILSFSTIYNRGQNIFPPLKESPP